MDGPIRTGFYDLVNMKAIAKQIAREKLKCRVVLPVGWAKTKLPVFPPDTLRYLDISTAADSKFPSDTQFVLEVGKNRFNWKVPENAIMKQPASLLVPDTNTLLPLSVVMSSAKIASEDEARELLYDLLQDKEELGKIAIIAVKHGWSKDTLANFLDEQLSKVSGKATEHGD